MGSTTVPPMVQTNFGLGIVTPLAQITVIDGSFGDCNIVDFCRLPLPAANASSQIKDNFKKYGWRRTIIDTGPTAGGLAISATLQLLAGQLTLPAMPGQTVYTVPNVSDLQITHPDDDHIGNARKFLTNMCNGDPTGAADGLRNIDRIKGCKVTFCALPPPYQKATIGVYGPSYTSQNIGGTWYEVDTVMFNGSLDTKWVEKMELAGFTPVISTRPCDKNGVLINVAANFFSQNNYTWDLDGDVCTLIYTQAAAQKNIPVYVKSSVSFTYSGDRNMKAKEKMKNGVKTLTIKRKPFPDEYRPILELDSTVLERFQKIEPFNMVWIGSTTAKKQKTGSGGKQQKLMSNMVFQPTALQGEPRQVVSLADTIVDLNKNTKVVSSNGQTTAPNLCPQTPETGQIVSAYPEADPQKIYGFQRTLGPSPELYGDMMRKILLAGYKLNFKWKTKDDVVLPVLDDSIINRSSIITMFERPFDQNVPGDSSFSMLFTGDAFDKACDIRDTLISWRPGVQALRTTIPTIKVDLLKIPHHGSDRSQSSGFYAYVRANTYLICGSICNSSGNPKLSTLEAIVAGFKGNKTPDGSPFRLFFSSTKINIDYSTKEGKLTWRSPVDLLNNSGLKATPATGNYYYEMYMPIPPKNSKYAAFGSIWLGKNAAGVVTVGWNSSQWQKISP